MGRKASGRVRLCDFCLEKWFLRLWERFRDFLFRRGLVIFCKSLAIIFLYTLLWQKNLVLHDLIFHLPHQVGQVELELSLAKPIIFSFSKTKTKLARSSLSMFLAKSLNFYKIHAVWSFGTIFWRLPALYPLKGHFLPFFAVFFFKLYNLFMKYWKPQVW